MTSKTEKPWFDEWFDTPYYHILYKDRNETEAQLLMDNLATLLVFAPHQKILDLACGKGRHAIYLNSKGFDVVGIDLSTNSIAHAQQFANEKLHFARHDMREVYQPETFDVVLNLFTSFGYFETEKENQQAISAAAANLKKGGKFVLDFFNTEKVIAQLKWYEQKVKNDLLFTIYKKVENNFIVKDIHFEVANQPHNYQERVKAITDKQFETYFEQAGLRLLHTFGNYQLQPYLPTISDRWIGVAEKIN